MKVQNSKNDGRISHKVLVLNHLRPELYTDDHSVGPAQCWHTKSVSKMQHLTVEIIFMRTSGTFQFLYTCMS
jgi:hypothetical protein